MGGMGTHGDMGTLDQSQLPKGHGGRVHPDKGTWWGAFALMWGHHVPPCVTTCHYMPPCATTCHHVSPHTTTCHHMPPHTTVSYHMPPRATTAQHVPPCPTTSHHVPPHATMCHHEPPHATTSRNMPPCATTRHHVPPHAVCRHMSPCATTCHHMPPRPTTCHHVPPHATTCHCAHRWWRTSGWRATSRTGSRPSWSSSTSSSAPAAAEVRLPRAPSPCHPPRGRPRHPLCPLLAGTVTLAMLRELQNAEIIQRLTESFNEVLGTWRWCGDAAILSPL